MASYDSGFDFFNTGDSNSYSGYYDGVTAYSGSSTFQDVQLGSPLVLDTSYLDSVPNAGVTSVNDFLSTDYDNWDFFTPQTQTLTGASDTPIGSADMSSPTPNTSTMGENSWNAVTALSKFGSSLASLFGGQPQAVSSMPYRGGTPLTQAGAVPLSAAVSGSNTLLLLVVVAALGLLLLRGE